MPLPQHNITLSFLCELLTSSLIHRIWCWFYHFLLHNYSKYHCEDKNIHRYDLSNTMGFYFLASRLPTNFLSSNINYSEYFSFGIITSKYTISKNLNFKHSNLTTHTFLYWPISLVTSTGSPLIISFGYHDLNDHSYLTSILEHLLGTSNLIFSLYMSYLSQLLTTSRFQFFSLIDLESCLRHYLQNISRISSSPLHLSSQTESQLFISQNTDLSAYIYIYI